MEFILGILKGIALGAGAILPGISSGVLCVVFGIYEKLVNSVLNFFKSIKANISFLLPILIGMIIGVVLFGNILRFLFNTFPIETKMCFLGLIMGSIPALVKSANEKNGFQLHFLVYTFITFLITLLLLYLENNLVYISTFENTNFLFLVLSGFIMSFGVIVPGVSSSVLLMMIGIYDTYLFSISVLDFTILFPMGIGLIIGSIFLLKLMQYCLNNFHTQTYYSILGFVLGSLPILTPSFSLSSHSIIGCIIFFLSILLSIILEK